jgi:ribosomal protein S18 acetylase RimI-like enzyme
VVTIAAATEVTPELTESIARLLPFLSQSAPPPTIEQLTEMVASPATTLFVARDDATKTIVGTLTLVIFRIPTGVRAWIEDVIVDGETRGQGIGAGLTRAALDTAAAAGARTVELTSRPSREAANRLYERLGFVARETNLYRYDLSAAAAGRT